MKLDDKVKKSSCDTKNHHLQSETCPCDSLYILPPAVLDWTNGVSHLGETNAQANDLFQTQEIVSFVERVVY